MSDKVMNLKEKLKEKIGLAIGEASTHWVNFLDHGDLVYDSTRGSKLVDTLTTEVLELLSQGDGEYETYYVVDVDKKYLQSVQTKNLVSPPSIFRKPEEAEQHLGIFGIVKQVIEIEALQSLQAKLVLAEEKIRELEDQKRRDIWKGIDNTVMAYQRLEQQNKELRSENKVLKAKFDKAIVQRNNTIERYYSIVEPSSSAHRRFGIDQKKDKYNYELKAITKESLKGAESE